MSKQWNELPEKTLYWMDQLGYFSPTVHKDSCEVKGYTCDIDGEGGKTYYTSTDLFELAQACTEVGEWLENRANGGGE